MLRDFTGIIIGIIFMMTSFLLIAVCDTSDYEQQQAYANAHPEFAKYIV